MQGESRLDGLRELVRTNGEIKNIDSGRSVRRRRVEGPQEVEALEGTRRTRLGVADTPWEGDAITEGPFVVKIGKKYVLTYSGRAFWDPDYAVGYALADKPEGPWRKSASNPILRRFRGLRGTGHHSLFKDKDGKWRIGMTKSINCGGSYGDGDPGLRVFRIRTFGSFESWTETEVTLSVGR